MINRAIIIIALLCYVGNYPVAQRLFPDVSKDYYVFIEFVRVRDIFYEVIMFWMFFLTYRQGERLVRTVSIIGLVLIGGSLVDKVIFDIHQYLWSDILLVIFSFLLAYTTYKNYYNERS
jgi:hypothetical protein